MNWQHLTLIVWLRWRLSYNQWRRTGALNALLTVGLVIAMLVASFIAFFVALIAGCLTLGKIEPDHLMLLWDVIIIAFLFTWSMGVLTELQRSEFLSMETMLHLPISPTSALLLNYLSSFVSFSILVFLPSMIGLSLALVVTRGPAMLLLFPLVIGFLMMVSALTYQFRGWMATVMKDKRRRRTIIACLTTGLILLSQLPNLAHFMFRHQQRERRENETAAMAELTQQLQSGEIDGAVYTQRREALKEELADEAKRLEDDRWARVTENIALANVIVPVGWLPAGVRAAAVGNPWPGLLGVLGLASITGASLWRSQRAALRLATGQLNSAKSRRNVRPERTPTTTAPFLERTLPGCSQHVSVVTLVALRNMLRSPEGKMALLSPFILVVIFGGVVFLGPGREMSAMPVVARPFLALCAVALTMLGTMQLVLNVFGMDRAGFRAYVLMPIARRDILLGKNLASGPIAALLAIIIVLVVESILPLRPMHLVAILAQLPTVFIILCLVGNMASIFAPMAVAIGSLKPEPPKFWPLVLQSASALAIMGGFAPAMMALLVEFLLDKFAGGRWFPLFLLVTMIELPVACLLYPFLLARQGLLLQRREAHILEVVTSHLE